MQSLLGKSQGLLWTPPRAGIEEEKLMAKKRTYGELEQRVKELEEQKPPGDSLQAFVNDILDLSKIESGWLALDRMDFNLADHVADTLKGLAVRAHEKGLELACHVLPDVPETVTGDPGRLRQILVNLVSNAINATSEGDVRVRVEKEPDAGDKICLRFTVADTGVGICPERQQLIFEPFAQMNGSATRKYGSTGFGLAISSRLVEMMGGHVQLESQFGKGTTMQFTARFGPAN
jgi:two-component system sensor histidine kinase/response regulator